MSPSKSQSRSKPQSRSRPQSRPRASTSTDAGIASLGLALPGRAMDVRALAEMRGVDPDKYTLGLGCGEMALCGDDETVVDLAVRAAERALFRWRGSVEDLGLLAVGTESAVDMSRPLSAWVAEALGLRGAVRSYEVKHACYGGTLALRQAVEWKLAGAAGAGGAGSAALVIAADVALYAPEDPGEPTQGAGAVAMVIDGCDVAALDRASYAWSEPEFDFWRPVGESFPRVDGPLSLDCYRRGAAECFRQWIGERPSAEALAELDAICFHVPFPKMVKKAVIALGESFGWPAEDALELFRAKVDPTMDWNRRCGNAYTASLWISVARALAGRAEGDRIAAFSYGSGFGAELTTLTAGPAAAAADWKADMETDLGRRELVDAATYARMRGEAPALVAAG